MNHYQKHVEKYGHSIMKAAASASSLDAQGDKNMSRLNYLVFCHAIWTNDYHDQKDLKQRCISSELAVGGGIVFS